MCAVVLRQRILRCASNDTGGVIACFKAGGEEKNWWPKLCRPTPPAVPAQDDRLLFSISGDSLLAPWPNRVRFRPAKGSVRSAFSEGPPSPTLFERRTGEECRTHGAGRSIHTLQRSHSRNRLPIPR